MISHLLISYINRSGSTLLSNFLSQHQEFCVCPEADILVKKFLTQPYKKNIDHTRTKKSIEFLVHNNVKLSGWKLMPSDIEIIANQSTYLEIFLSFLRQYQKRYFANAKTIVFKAVEIVNVIDTLTKADLELFSIKYLTLIRDPRACFASQLTTVDPYNKQKMNTNPLITAYTWNKLIDTSIRFKERNPKSLHILRYEDFVLNLEKALNEIAELLAKSICGLKKPKSEWLFYRIPAEQKEIHQRVNFDPEPKRISAWKSKLGKTTISIIQSKTKGYSQQCGYADDLKTNVLWCIIKKYYYKFRIFFLIDRY